MKVNKQMFLFVCDVFYSGISFLPDMRPFFEN